MAPGGSISIASLPARARTSTIRTSSVSLSPRPRSLEASTTAVSRYVASASGGSFAGETPQRAAVPRDARVRRRGRERLLRAAASHVARRRPVRALRGGEQARGPRVRAGLARAREGADGTYRALRARLDGERRARRRDRTAAPQGRRPPQHHAR